ncbi:MAG: DNA polymerase I [Endomicrobium sp.]|jgi:DNA polymerase-1|nr:DNA polymerase I [Endomicrobium sp.]
MKKFFVIDGNTYIHRAYHALPPLSASNGQQINAVYGFVKLLTKIKNNFAPDYIVVCFDYPSKNFRYGIFKDYKANRNPLDETLISQMPIAKEAVEALAMAKIEMKGYEADDLIATIVENNKKNDVQTVIVTADKDIFQLIEEQNVLVWNDSKNVMYDVKKVKQTYGVMPNQLIDVFALMGDVVDNIPGIKGIGKKTAIKLVKRFGTLENILQNLDFIEGNVRKLLKHGKDNALISRKLLDLNRQVPLSFKLENFESKDLDLNKAVPFFEKYEFKSFLKKYSYKYQFEKLKKRNNCNSIASIRRNANVESYEINCKNKGLFNPERVKVPFNFDSEIVNTKERAIQVAKLIKHSGIFAMKTIKSSPNFLKTYIVGISLYTDGKAFYFPIGHSGLNSNQMTIEEFKDVFALLFYSNSIKKVGDNLKQEKNVYKILKIKLNGIYFDVMLASYCLNPVKPHNISYIAKEYLNFKAGDDSYLRKGTKKIKFANASIEDVAKYANSISAASFAMYKIFELLIEKKKLSSLFFDVEMPLIEILSEMEISGIKIDLSFLNRFNEEVTSKLEEIEDDIYKMADMEFNINSTKQLSHIMFDKLNLPVIKRTKTGYSTDELVLRELSSYEFPARILKYRELQKLKSTYIFPIMNYCVCGRDRIHTVFNQSITATGRLSSTEPNLQNIPMRSTYGREFRKVFVSEDNKVFLSADYSQIDLRVLAHISQDEKLMEAFKSGVDVHSATAREIFNIPKNESVSDDLRSMAKSINFGIIYGMSPFGLSKQLNIPFSEAREYIDEYFKRYSGVKLWMDQVIERASREGYVCTINGRVRFVPELRSMNVQVRNASERIALNTPVQGSSADIIKIAMINIYNEIKLKDYKSLMLLQIHDDLLFEVPIEELEDVILIIKSKMESSVTLSVPLVTNVKVGKNLGEMKKYDNRTNWRNCYRKE